MNKWLKISIVSISVLLIGISLMAFRPFGDPQDGNSTADYTVALANALGISVEELESAFDAVKTTMIEQAVDDGNLTQEQADQILEGDTPSKGRFGKHPGPRMSGDDYNALLAEELNIDVETLVAAQQEAHETLLNQALEDGTITQEEYDRIQVRTTMAPYFTDAFSQAYQNAVETALADGVISDAQAEELLENTPAFEPGMGLPGFGHRPGRHPHFNSPLDSSGN